MDLQLNNKIIIVTGGAKGIGELPMDAGAPAIIDAIHDATGAWITELPATPARVLTALRAIEERAAGKVAP